MPEEALTGLKVLDLSTEYAGPYCTKLLADSGAEVIKVEPPAGDPSRRWGPFPGGLPDAEKSGAFLYLNTNKRGVMLDLGSPSGRKLLRPLLEWADIVVESYAPGTLEGWGLGYPALEAINPALVLTSITPFGQTGPYAHWQGGEIIIQAMAMLMQMSGAEDREPLKYPTMQAQFGAGANAAGVSLVAWFSRQMTGQGQHVDVSMMESMAGYFYGIIPQYSYTGSVQRRVRNPASGEIFMASDGQVMPAQGPSSTWDDFVSLLDAPELLDPKFATPVDRAINQAAYYEILIPKLMERTRREWFDVAQAMRMPWGYVQTLDEIAADPHLEVREFWVDVEHPAAGHLRLPGRPFKMSEAPPALRRPAPLLGQHNVEVYGQIAGLSNLDVALLRAAGVV